MKKTFLWPLALGVSALATACSSGFQLHHRYLGDGRVYWGSLRNGSVNRGEIDQSFPPPQSQLWRYKCSSPLTTTPLVRGNLVIVSPWDKKLIFLDISTGLKVAQLSVPAPPTATPCLVEDKIYFGTGRLSRKVYAFKYLSGKLQWQKEIGEVTSPVVAEGERLLVAVAGGTLLCLDRAAGSELWNFKAGDNIHGAPAVRNGRVFFGSLDGGYYCLNLMDGNKEWRYKLDSPVQGAATVEGSQLYFGTSSGKFFSISVTGESLWCFSSGGAIYSSPAVDSSGVYFGSNDGNLYCLDKKTGDLNWKFTTTSLIHSSPILVGKWVCFGSFDRYFYVLDKTSGEVAFKQKTEGIISASPSFAKGYYLLGSEDKYVYCFK